MRFVSSASEVQAAMLSLGGAVAGVLFADNTLDANAVSSMRATYRKPFVAFGMRSLKATGLPADDYLQVPQMAGSCGATSSPHSIAHRCGATTSAA